MKKYIKGDIHEVIKDIEDNSIDFIYTDPPFSTTNAKWDDGLKWATLFTDMWRVLKPNGIIALYASMPFTYELLKHETPKYHYCWKKNNSTLFLSAKYQPLRNIEEIFIYYKKRGTYNPQMEGDEVILKHYGGKHNGQNYYGIDSNDKQPSKEEAIKGAHKGKYPTSLREWDIARKRGGITRTDEQIDYFIKTYSNEGDTILDMTCCDRYVGDRAEALNRNYIGVDLNMDFLEGITK
jgi:DNA modification methylase